ncbi:MAG: hypothetical protein EOO61_07415 [Hymenobacter sp.]|nr:MAG: hypothetical protein EOO61_07415 [Hymenobacter sp.]
MLKNFMHDMVDKKLSNTEIGDKYFCTAVLHRTDRYGEKARGYLNYSLSQQRDDIRTQQVDLSKVKLKTYDSLPSSELPPKPFHMLDETKYVYVVQYHGKIILYILLQNNKIASTTLIGQGDEHYFMDLCN